MGGQLHYLFSSSSIVIAVNMCNSNTYSFDHVRILELIIASLAELGCSVFSQILFFPPFNLSEFEMFFFQQTKSRSDSKVVTKSKVLSDDTYSTSARPAKDDLTISEY